MSQLFEQRRQVFLCDLASDAVVTTIGHARDVVADELDRVKSYDDFEDGEAVVVDPEDWRFMDETTYSLEVLWVVIGIIYRALQDEDVVDQKRLLPRELLINGAKSLPALRACLDIAQSELHASRPRYSAAEIVADLVPGVEALCKDLWATDFEGKSRVPVTEVLAKRMRGGNPIDARFASVGLCLYKLYRDASTHERHRIHRIYTSLDSLFVYSGMRLMLHEYGVIKERLGGDLREAD